MTAGPTRVVLVEDHRLLAQSMVIALSAGGFDVAAVAPAPPADDQSDLFQRIVASRPDVVLLDLDLGAAGDGAPLIGPLHRAGSAVVVVTAATDLIRWGECLARGARTVLPKSAPLEEITDTIRHISAGRAVISPVRRSELVRRWHQRNSQGQNARDRLSRLTPRERHVLAALVAGKRVREISVESVVSEATVRSQVKSVLAKLRVTSQIAAVATARNAGWDLRA